MASKLRKISFLAPSQLSFDNNTVAQSVTQQHLGTFLCMNAKLDFHGHLKNILNKVNKKIGLLCKIHNTYTRLPLLTIYKLFIRLHMNYEDVVSWYDDQTYSAFFHQKLESIQYNLAPGYNRTSTRKLYDKLC